MWYVWSMGAVGSPGRYLGTIFANDELTALQEARNLFSCNVYVVRNSNG